MQHPHPKKITETPLVYTLRQLTREVFPPRALMSGQKAINKYESFNESKGK